MAVFYFDTSALVKRHVNEPGSASIRSLTKAKAAHTLFIARITAVESFAAITRRQRGGSLSAAQGGAILGHFRRHRTQRYGVVEVTPQLVADAMLSARTYGLRAYDAMQLAAAHEANRIYRTAGLGPITLVSADLDLNIAAAASGLPVEDPHSHP
jgi:predicted nucleic acid-binding protein